MIRFPAALLLACFLVLQSRAALQPVPAAPESSLQDPSGIDFFEKKIRPVLADKCYKCHSSQAESIKGGLTLDTRDGARQGGDSGPAVIPGDLKNSLLIQAIHYENKDFAMPPKKAGGKLPDEIIADFEKWISIGAPDPREEKLDSATLAKTEAKKTDYGAAKDWWAWKPPIKAQPPVVKESAWPHNEIDRFLLAAMEAKGVKPVHDADKLTLLRRVYYDLTGLPPTIADIKAFAEDRSPEAFEKVVDRLLSSPAFGECWGRHWLDVSRFAESTGKDINFAYPYAWRYRDYVIDAFNKDKPYDEFLREQLAGDLLPAKDDAERAEHLVATGFLAIGTRSLNERNPREFILDVADEQLDTVSQSMLGMTIACARCHDHKFDPIPQKDYYALAGIFTSTKTCFGTAFGPQNRHASDLLLLPAGANIPVVGHTLTPAEIAAKQQQLEADKTKVQEAVRERFLAANNPAAPANPANAAQDGKKAMGQLFAATEAGILDAELAEHDEQGKPKALAMGATDLSAHGFGAPAFGRPSGPAAKGKKARFGAGFGVRPPDFATISDCALYIRGDAEKPSEKVPRGFPSIITVSTPPSIPQDQSGRLQLAEFIADGRNPLTARVMTNRVWKWIFGAGIVASTDNFGSTGVKPTNQELLDTLALSFQENGWSIKKIVREIVLSHAYQLSSAFDDADYRIDPENNLLWRMSKRRLDAESIRDSMLAASGTLDSTRPVGDVIASAGNGQIGGRRRGAIDEASIANSDTASRNRSIYLPTPRDVLPDSLATFDFADTSIVTGSRETTNVPSQALFMLNSSFVSTQAKALAGRLLAQYPGGLNSSASARFDERLNYLYWLALSRPPDPAERQASLNFLMKFPEAAKTAAPLNPAVREEMGEAAWTALCRAVFSCADFRYLN